MVAGKITETMAKALLKMNLKRWHMANDVGVTDKMMDALWCRHLVEYKCEGKKVEWRLTQIGTFVRKGLQK